MNSAVRILDEKKKKEMKVKYLKGLALMVEDCAEGGKKTKYKTQKD